MHEKVCSNFWLVVYFYFTLGDFGQSRNTNERSHRVQTHC